MKNFLSNTTLIAQNSSLGDEMKKAIIKAGLRQYSKQELAMYFECLVEVINEKGVEDETY
jgi:hypothetical protein